MGRKAERHGKKKRRELTWKRRGEGRRKAWNKKKQKAPKMTVTEEKDVVYASNIASFVELIVKERQLDPAKTIVRVGLDGWGTVHN